VEKRLQPLLELGPEGHWATIFRELQLEVDETGSIVDGSVVRAHQDAAGGKGGGRCNALGRSRGGFSTKLHVVVDTKARPIYVALTPGHRHEMMAAGDLLAHARGRALIGDTGYDSSAFLAAVRAKGMKPQLGVGLSAIVEGT